ncbi:hypothetical protein BKA83DRAFT_4500433 [Pisolithus microcarpus]|nr:hypothetical protein BKA83DRAFT_4500433 [Pisolithus microcarpus]
MVTNMAGNLVNEAILSKKGKGKILVYCSAAISRSPMVITAYLMKQNGMTLMEALGQIIHAWPQVSLNAGFLQQLKNMETELYGSMFLELRLGMKPVAPATTIKDALVITPGVVAPMPSASGMTATTANAVDITLSNTNDVIAKAELAAVVTVPDVVAPMLDASSMNMFLVVIFTSYLHFLSSE